MLCPQRSVCGFPYFSVLFHIILYYIIVELHKVVKDLEFRLDKLNEDRYVNSGLVEENNELKDRLKVRFLPV